MLASNTLSNIGVVVPFFPILFGFIMLQVSPLTAGQFPPDSINQQILDIHNNHEFEDIPSWIKDISDPPELLFIGPDLEELEFFKFVGPIISTKGDCISKKTKFLTFLTIHTYSIKFQTNSSITQTCEIIYWKNAEITSKHIAKEEMPLSTCNFRHSYIELPLLHDDPPGHQILFCDNSSVFTNLTTFMNIPTNCVKRYYSTTAESCYDLNIKQNRKLMSLGCTIDLEEFTNKDHNSVHVALPGEGEITVTSEVAVKHLHCTKECSVVVGDVMEVNVICPNGFTHKLHFKKDVRHQCYLSDNKWIGWFAMFLCKSSHNPWATLWLIIWILFGKVIIHIILFVVYLTTNKVTRFIRARVPNFDAELGICSSCGSDIMQKKDIILHNECHKGICAYCKKYQAPSLLISHIKVCSAHLNYVAAYIKKDTSALISDSWFASKVSKLMYLSFAHRVTYWLVILITFLIVCLPPVSSEHVDTLPPNFIHSRNTTWPYDTKELTENCLFNEIQAESTLCGLNCWHRPNECQCVKDDYLKSRDIIKGLNQELKDTEIFHLTDYNTNRSKRDIENVMTNANISVSQRNLAGAMLTLSRKHKHTRRLNRLKMQSKSKKNRKTYTNYASQVMLSVLPNLERIQTDWGVFDISVSPSTTTRENSFTLEWETQRTDKDNLYVKGYSTAELDLTPMSGVTWTITSSDSVENQRLSMFIYDFTQIYTGATHYHTYNRKFDKRFRGTCTGDCPNRCDCSSDLCFYKKWDYDRGWGCNPAWCWSSNAGCSCCGIEVKNAVHDWILTSVNLKYVRTEIILCVKFSNNAVNCQVTSDNKQIRINDITIHVSSLKGVIDFLPSSVAYLWHKKTSGKPKLYTKPDYILLDPEICKDSCNHGDVGDIKVASFKMAIGGGIDMDYKKMSWVGVDIEHTCHTGSWPECNIYGLHDDISAKFQFLNKSTPHIQESHFMQNIVLSNDNKGSLLYCRPKKNSGILSIAVQGKNIRLSKQESKLLLRNFKITFCEGCFACNTGFLCHAQIDLITPAFFNVHLTSGTTFVQINKLSIALDVKKNPNRFSFYGFTLINRTSIEVCIIETGICITPSVSLEEPTFGIVDTEIIHTITSSTNSQSSKEHCASIAIFGCIVLNGANFFSNLWNWIKLLFEYVAMIGIGLVIMILIYIAIKLSMPCIKMVKSVKNLIITKGKTHKKLIDAREYLATAPHVQVKGLKSK